MDGSTKHQRAIGGRVDVSIEVVLPKEASSTEKGRVLEKFARRLLETQNFRVSEEVRLAAMEVDLLAEDRTTGERVMVECKAYRQPISAEVLQKLLGQITFDDALTSGWLISTYALGKDAKGFRDRWHAKPIAERRKLRIYDPEALIERLISAQVIVDPQTLIVPPEIRASTERVLLITNFGEFWAVIVLDEASGIRHSAVLYDAHSGVRVTNAATTSRMSETDSTLAQLTWLPNEAVTAPRDAIAIQQELQSIVQVPIADHWADYRPARPEDFIGRDKLIDGVFDFFDAVRQGSTRTRLLAVKAPSGWGKSSFVLKLASTAHNIRNRNKYFVYAVDSRAATTKRFGELALATAIAEAIRHRFVTSAEALAYGGATNPFSDESLRKVMDMLRKEGKVICLIFDQFEELLYKSELEAVFDEIKTLCNSIDEAQEQLIVGFSWKTDGTIPTEHKAYHLWHNLADRRREVELVPFSAKEVSSALSRFAKELGQPLAPQLKRLLEDHCQGFPWLLKKLCIHILDLVRSGSDQNDILVRSLSIQELFRKDIERLSGHEYACVKEIAASAPADFFRVVESFGDDVVNQLLNKRLIIRSGPRLSIYWDIFKDYLLTERVPYIPINYVPQVTFANYVDGLRLLLADHTVSYSTLATELKIAKGTADNVVRDLAMIGHAEANRSAETVKLDAMTEEEAARRLVDFCLSHVVFRELLKDKSDGSDFTEDEMTAIAKRVLRLPTNSDALVREYRKRLLRWFIAVGVVASENGRLTLQARAPHTGLLRSARLVRRRNGNFMGEAPPSGTLLALRGILSERPSREDAEAKYGRNAVSCLVSLGMLSPAGSPCETPDNDQIAAVLRRKVKEQKTIKFVAGVENERPKMKPEEVGALLATQFGYKWSSASCKRYGSALNQWRTWAFSD